MIAVLRACFLFTLLVSGTSSSSPDPPSWPAVFSVNMTEQLNSTAPKTQVTYYRDSTRQAEKWVRHETGTQAQDGVCLGVDAPCTDLVAEGNRWIIHPTLGDCCLLGTSDHGCGALAADWMVRNPHTYAGRSMVEGVETDAWVVQGNGPNTYYQTVPPNPVPVKLDQGGFINVYDRNTFAAGQVDPKVFSVPSACSPDKKCKSQFPCSLGAERDVSQHAGAAAPTDLQRAKTKIPRKSYKGNDFADMTMKLNSFLGEYKNVKECSSWTLRQLQQFQAQMLSLRAPELDEVYQSTSDNRQLRGGEDFYMQEWDALANVSSTLSMAYQEMHRDGHCHEAVMWFVHHVSEPMRQKVAEVTSVPLLPHGSHSCPHAPTAHEKSVCDAYVRLVSCQKCHGDPKAIIV